MNMNEIRVAFDRADQYAYISPKAITVESDGEIIYSLTPHSSVEKLICEGAPEDWKSEKDIDKDDCTFRVIEEGGKKVFVWTCSSTNWIKKVYRLECDAKGMNFFVSVTGSGNVGKICYFDGAKKEAKDAGSLYNFARYYVPMCNTASSERQYYPTSMNYEMFFELFVPPMFCYAFETEDIKTWQGLGLVAKEGEHNFVQYDYSVVSNGYTTHFYMSTDMEGHKAVNGTWEAPFIRTLWGDSEADVVKAYSDYYFESGIAKPYNVEQHRWWYGPITCGWTEQAVARWEGCPYGQMDMARQDVYEGIVEKLDKLQLKPTILIVDDKWQNYYGVARPNPEKWPDMRGFVDKMHDRGIHTLLWFRLWGGEGLPEDETMPGNGVKGWNPSNNDRYADPSNPKYIARLKETLHYLLSDEPGCMNVDGFKLDFAFWMGYGRKAQSYSGEYGVELMKRLFDTIYDTAKAIKPDVLINASPCHPYFCDKFDQIRLHDCIGSFRKEEMTMRQKLFLAACPNHSVDTDDAGFVTRRDALRYVKCTAELGIPDLYQLTDPKSFHVTDEDWAVIRGVWEDYSRKMDEKFGL